MRRELGQFFSPSALVAACYALLQPALPSNPLIVDPACGDGAFLTYAARHGLAAPQNLHGCDLDPELAPAWRAAGLAALQVGDGLAPDGLPAAAFDLVIGNPPFGSHRLAHGLGQGQPAELRFLQRFLELARPNGLVCIVLPMGVLANARQRNVRALLLQNQTLLQLLELPAGLFAGTSARCVVLLLRKAPAPAEHTILIGSLQADAQGSLQAQYWPALAQAHPGLLERLDPPYWQPEYRSLAEQFAARWPDAALGELLGRSAILAGDHVRPGRGEQRGPGLPYEYYQTRQFRDAGYDYGRLIYCNARAFERLGHTAVRQWDLLVSCAGVGGSGRGRSCLITHQPGPSCTGDVLTIRARRPDPRLLYLLLRSRYGRGQLLRLQNGVGTSNLSVAELLQLRVPLLPASAEHELAVAYLPLIELHDAAIAAERAGNTLQASGLYTRAAQGLEALVLRYERLLQI